MRYPNSLSLESNFLKTRILVVSVIALFCSVFFVDRAMAVQAPEDGISTVSWGPYSTGDTVPAYYYVSNNVKQNGDWPNTYVAFYWSDSSGNKTVTYRGRQCNKGGYGDSNSSVPSMTLYAYALDANGNRTNTIISQQDIGTSCNNGNTKDITFNLSNTARDTRLNMSGVAIRVAITSTGRAFYTLNTTSTSADGTSAMFGALGGNKVGFSRDFNADQGGFYNLTMNFGSVCTTTATSGTIGFYDIDDGNKYQSKQLTFRVWDVEGGSWLDSSSTQYSSLSKITRLAGKTTLSVDSGSGSSSSVKFTMAADRRYKIEIRNISDMNDIAVSLPTAEIYGKVLCEPPPTWTMSGYTLASSPTATAAQQIIAAPGQQVTFTHHVVNNGPSTTDQQIWTDTQVSGGLGNVKAGHRSDPYTASQDKVTDTDTITIPGSAINGQKYCQFVRYSWTSYNNSALSSGAQACVTVQLGYILTPVVTVAPGAVVHVGTDFSFSYNVVNPTSFMASAVDWKIRQTVTSPTGVVTSTDIALGNKAAVTGSWSPRATDNITNIYPVGTKVCRYLWINPSTQAANTPSEQGSCVLIAAAPYMSVLGGNVWAGGSADDETGNFGVAKISGTSPSNFGSFGEYGVFATGTIDFFGSAGRLGAFSHTATLGPAGAKLTFGSAVSLGDYSTSHKIADLVAQYRLASSTPVVNGSSIITGSGVYKAPSGSTVVLKGIAGNNRAIIYIPDGTVRITSDIVYSAAATSFGDLPSLTIIAKDIIVSGSVGEIDGNLYALNSFVSCDEGPKSVAENGVAPLGKSAAITNQALAACNHQLIINGTLTVANSDIAANKNALVLNRSFGGTTTGEPAEIIRMRPESFLTSFENSLQLTTVHETELPARY